MTIALWALAILMVVVGLAGTILPGLPGNALVFAGLLLAAYLQDFAEVGGIVIGVLGFLTLASFAVDLIAGALGAKRVGASSRAVAGAALGTVAGMPFGIAGLLVGPFLGAAIGELSVGTDLVKAGKVGFGAWLGFVVGTILKLGLAFAMVGIFLVAYLF